MSFWFWDSTIKVATWKSEQSLSDLFLTCWGLDQSFTWAQSICHLLMLSLVFRKLRGRMDSHQDWELPCYTVCRRWLCSQTQDMPWGSPPGCEALKHYSLQFHWNRVTVPNEHIESQVCEPSASDAKQNQNLPAKDPMLSIRIWCPRCESEPRFNTVRIEWC